MNCKRIVAIAFSAVSILFGLAGPVEARTDDPSAICRDGSY